jgi:two-component system, NarL family, response regulator
MSKRKSVRILVVEDHPVTRLGIVAIMHASGYFDVVAEADSCASALKAFADLRPDIVLLDVRLPDGDGIEVLERFRALEPNAKVVVLTSLDAEEPAWQAMQANVNGYLPKSTPPQELVAAVKSVIAGGAAFPPDFRASIAARDLQAELTSREHDVLRLLVAGRTNAEIGSALGIGRGTARTHVSSILQKLEVASRTEAATAAIRRGIV